MRDSWLLNVKHIRGKKLPLTAAGVHSQRDEYTPANEPVCVLAAESLRFKFSLSDLVNQTYALAPAEIDLKGQTAPPRMPIPPLAT